MRDLGARETPLGEVLILAAGAVADVHCSSTTSGTPSGDSGWPDLGFHGQPLSLALPVTNERAKQLVEIRLSRFHEHTPVATDRHRPIASGVHPTLLGYPLHLA